MVFFKRIWVHLESVLFLRAPRAVLPPLRTPVGAIFSIPRAYVFRMEIEHTALFSLAPWDVLEDLCLDPFCGACGCIGLIVQACTL